jgi:hypothetical protein
MARGGARTGAGRPKGLANKFNDEARARAAEGGTTPLEYLLGLLRDETQPKELRIDVAKAAAPYMHARLAAVEHSGDKDKPIAHTVSWAE